MTQITLGSHKLADSASKLLALLEDHRTSLPFAEEELANHHQLRQSIEEYRIRGEQALSNWRIALARRWECEIAGQRVYTSVQHQIRTFYGDEAPYLHIIAPSTPESLTTAEDLLAGLRRLEASLALLAPSPPFADHCRNRLILVADQLAAAISETTRYEVERRNIQLECRLTTNLYQQACDRTRRLLANLGDKGDG